MGAGGPERQPRSTCRDTGLGLACAPEDPTPASYTWGPASADLTAPGPSCCFWRYGGHGTFWGSTVRPLFCSRWSVGSRWLPVFLVWVRKFLGRGLGLPSVEPGLHPGWQLGAWGPRWCPWAPSGLGATRTPRAGGQRGGAVPPLRPEGPPSFSPSWAHGLHIPVLPRVRQCPCPHRCTPALQPTPLPCAITAQPSGSVALQG